jgi:nucleoside-diphosphate-sugar epimerase
MFNVATGRSVTLNQTFNLLQGLTSYKGQPKYGPDRGGDIRHSLANISKAEAGLGYTPKVDFEEGLRRTVDWYRGK